MSNLRHIKPLLTTSDGTPVLEVDFERRSALAPVWTFRPIFNLDPKLGLNGIGLVFNASAAIKDLDFTHWGDAP